MELWIVFSKGVKTKKKQDISIAHNIMYLHQENIFMM